MILAEKQQISEEYRYTTVTVSKARPDYRPELKPFLIVGGFFIVLSLINLWIQVVNVKRSDEIKNYRAAIRGLERESIQIRVEMARLESFERISKIAQTELHMKVAGPTDYQLIAGVPSLHQNEPRPYNSVTKTALPNNHVWGKLATWFEGVRSAMAQSN
jgi:cell division protein FtsB